MKPSQISQRLRQIAAAIEASKNPSRSRVAADVRQILASIGPLWVTVSLKENRAHVFQSKEEAGAMAVESGEGLVSEAGSVGVIVYTEGYDVKAEPASELPIMGTEEVADMAEGIAETVWFDTRTAVPGDVLEPFAMTNPALSEPEPEAAPADGEPAAEAPAGPEAEADEDGDEDDRDR